MKYLAFIIIFLASVVTRGATLNGVLYDSSTKDIKPTGNVLVGTFSSVSSATVLGGTATLTNALTVPNGGSGVATLALNGILYGNGASAMQALAVNSTGTRKFLSQISSGAPSWADPLGTGTAGVSIRWSSTGSALEDGYFIDGSGFTVPRTNNAITFGSTTNRLAGINSVNVNFSGQLTSTIASGTPPFVVASGTEVANLNAQYLGGVTRDYFNVGFILGDTSYWNGSGNPTRLLPNPNTNIAFYVQYGTGNAYPNISVAPFWMQVSAGSNISISRSTLTNFTINASTAAGVAVGTGTTGTYPIWSNGSGGLTDGALAASSATNATLTGNILANGAVFTNNVGIGKSGPVTPLEIIGNITNSSSKFGAFEIQSYAVNNGWLADNLYFGATGYKYRDNGSGTLLYFRENRFLVRLYPTGVVGTSASSSKSPLKIQQNGAVGMGGDMTSTVDDWNGSSLNINTSGNVGIGTVAQAARLHVEHITEQFRLSYNSTSYVSRTVNISGNENVAPSGGTENITGALVVSGTVTASAYIESGSSFGLTSDATVANTASETTLLGTAGSGSKTLSVNVLTVGRTLHGVLRGRYSSAAIAGTLRIKVKFGSTVILDTAAQTMPNASSGKAFDIDYDITCRTTGGTGTVFAQGKVLIGDVTGLVPQVLPMVNTTTSTIDTTATQVVDVTATWGTADAGNTVTGSVGSLQ